MKAVNVAGPVIRASCALGSEVLAFQSPMDWIRKRVYMKRTPWNERPVCQSPSEVHLRLDDYDDIESDGRGPHGIVRFLPIGDGNGGKSAQIYVDTRQRYVFKLLLRQKTAYGPAAIARDACIRGRALRSARGEGRDA